LLFFYENKCYFRGATPWQRYFRGATPWQRYFRGATPWQRYFRGATPWQRYFRGAAPRHPATSFYGQTYKRVLTY